jgi:Flp pilus assembly pilin Flp
VTRLTSKAMQRLWEDQSGAAAVEYVVMVAAIFTALVPGFYYVSSAIGLKFEFITDFVVGL